MKRILITGLGSKLAWKIRAEQIGEAMGARVMAHAARGDMQRADVVVVCKWHTRQILSDLRKWGGPWAWDIVDAYPQPEAYTWDRDAACLWLRNALAETQPKAMVAATKRMLEDASYAGIALPHHARPGQDINPIRRVVKRVGYEGLPKYLNGGKASWRSLLEKECAARGWEFVVNPARLADVDILVALREGSNYVARSYKSNVKLANAQATATPIICAREWGYMETDNGGAVFVTSADDLTAAFDTLTPFAEREARSHKLHMATPKIEHVAASYRKWLERL